jgi:hypothetical protein
MFHDHRTKVSVNLPHELIALGIGVTVAERVPQVLDRDFAVTCVDAIREPREEIGESIGLLNAHGLGHGHDQADEQIDGIVDETISAALHRPSSGRKR